MRVNIFMNVKDAINGLNLKLVTAVYIVVMGQSSVRPFSRALVPAKIKYLLEIKSLV
jgi:hypothetical protein